MNTYYRVIRCLTASLILVTAWAASGCGPAAEYDKAVQYSPESLAQELAFRYRSLSPSAKTAIKNRNMTKDKTKAFAATELEAQTKGQSKAATKKAPAANVDDVLDDVAEKVEAIKGVAPSEVYQKMAEAIAHDQSLEEKDRQTLADKLKEMGKIGK